MWNLLLVLERLVLSSSYCIMGKVVPICCDVRCGVDQGFQPMWSMNFFAFDVTTGWIFQSAEPAGICYNFKWEIWCWIGCVCSCIFYKRLLALAYFTLFVSLVCKSISQTTDRGACGDRPRQTLAHWAFCLRQGDSYYVFACAKVACTTFSAPPPSLAVWTLYFFPYSIQTLNST